MKLIDYGAGPMHIIDPETALSVVSSLYAITNH